MCYDTGVCIYIYTGVYIYIGMCLYLCRYTRALSHAFGNIGNITVQATLKKSPPAQTLDSEIS